jgi:hypothetical protein
MKRIVILVALLLVAGIAGIVRSKGHGHVGVVVSQDSSADSRDEIRKSYELAPGAKVEINGINGSVKVETADTKTAEVFIERTASSQEALDRRRINIDADANGLRIWSEKGDVGFFARLFGSNPSERVTLKLPHQVSLTTKGINGSLIVGDLDGSVEVRGVNGRVQIASANGTVDFKGINGNIQVGLKQLSPDGVSISGINGNIELQLGAGLNADLDAHGMNGRVVSELSEVIVEKDRGGRYSARIGNGGNAITAKGINGNIRLTRGSATTATTVDSVDSKRTVVGSGQN